MDTFISLDIDSREGLGPSPKLCALPSLRTGWGVGWKATWREGEEKREWQLGLVCMMKKKFLFFKKKRKRK